MTREFTETISGAGDTSEQDGLPASTFGLLQNVAGEGGPEMSVIEHLEELRWRIIKCLLALVTATIAVFCVNAHLIRVLERPLDASRNLFGVGTSVVPTLVFTSPAEYFVAVCKIALLGGLYLTLPVLLYQALAFVSPGLTFKERRLAAPVVVGSFLFFTIGAIFSYYLILPTGLQFLVGFAPPEVKPMLSIGKYLGFSAGLLFATGLAFELPLVLLGAAAMGVTTSYQLVKYRRHAFLAAFALGAVITPSVDVFSQGLLAVALYGLFELSILLIRMIRR